MSSIRVPYRIEDDNPYVNDQGSPLSFNPVLFVPSDLNEGKVDSLLECIQGERRFGTTPCGEKGITRPRKLKFIRSNGGSMSIIVPDREKIIEVAQCGYDIFKDTESKVICIELQGEVTLDLKDDLVEGEGEGDDQASSPIAPKEDDRKHSLWYTSTMKAYKTDAVFGAEQLVGFKIQTDTENAPYEPLKDAIESCIGDLTTVKTCTARKSRKYRRYIPSIFTKVEGNGGEEGEEGGENSGDKLQTLTVPVAENTAEEIKSCGSELAKFKFVICLRYEGESNNRIHKLITLEGGNGGGEQA